MNNLMIEGSITVLGKEIPIIELRSNRHLLVESISKFYNRKTNKINELINNNIHRFNNNELINLIHDENAVILLRDSGIFTQNKINASKNIYLLSERGYIKLSNLMKGRSHVSTIILNEYFNSNDIISEPTNTKEYDFYEKLYEQLVVFNVCDGESQYSCCNNKYKIDYYIPSLNIAIEYDENDHKYYTYDNQEGRQKEIENELNCKFIRVSNKYSINTAIAIVFKNLLNMKLL